MKEEGASAPFLNTKGNNMAETYEETLKEWIERFKSRELLRRSSSWLQYDFADEIAEVLSKELQRHEKTKQMDNMKAIDIIEGHYEDLEEHEYISAWQHLIDNGLVWQLQGYFGRMAARLIEDGVCTK